MKCKCLCGREVRPGNTYFGQSCRQRYHASTRVSPNLFGGMFKGRKVHHDEPAHPATCGHCGMSGSRFAASHLWIDALGRVQERCPHHPA
jgi:hypothetical protein